MNPGAPIVSIVRIKGQVDETGQPVSMNVPRRRKRRKGWRDHVSLVDIDSMVRLDVTGGERRVLFAVMSHVPEKGGVEARTTAAEIAEQMGLSQPYIWKVMKALKDRNLIRSVRRGVWEVNPWLMFNGDFDSWNAETELWDEPMWDAGVDLHTGEVL